MGVVFVDSVSISGFGGLAVALDAGLDIESIFFGLAVLSSEVSGLDFRIALLVFARTSILTFGVTFLFDFWAFVSCPSFGLCISPWVSEIGIEFNGFPFLFS